MLSSLLRRRVLNELIILKSRRRNRRSRLAQQERGLTSLARQVDLLEDRTLLSVDFGDAPEPYPVTRAEGGAEHGIDGYLQLGADIDGEFAGDQSGFSVSLSADGATVVIGAPNNDGNGNDSGHTRIFRFDSDSLSWSQLDSDIDGEFGHPIIGDQSGSSVSLSADGTTVAIGATRNEFGQFFGQTRIFRYDVDANSWFQLGTDIDGEAANDQSGQSVSLSADGATVAIGSSSGSTRIFRYDADADSWFQLGTDDDDGVTFSTNRIAAGLREIPVSVSVDVQGASDSGAKLDAWIDFNSDGDWLDHGEQIFQSEFVTNGSNELQFEVPAHSRPGTTYARFRVSSSGGLLPGGTATDGEVEDYALGDSAESFVRPPHWSVDGQ